jgi:hypothetical protein
LKKKLKGGIPGIAVELILNFRDKSCLFGLRAIGQMKNAAKIECDVNGKHSFCWAA